MIIIFSTIYECAERSVIEVIRRDSDHILRPEIDADEGFTTVLFLILIHIVNFLDSRLLDDLSATETGIVGGIQPASLGLSYSHLNDGRLLGVETETLVQLLPLVVVASLAAHPVTGGDLLRSTVVSGGYDSVLVVDDDRTDRRLHAVRPSSVDIGDLHEILVPCGSKISNDILILPLQLHPQLLFPSPVQHPRPDKLQTLLKFLLMVGFIQSHQLSDSFEAVLPAGVEEKPLEALLEGGIDEDHIDVVAFLELKQQFAVDQRREEDCTRARPELPEAHLPHILGEQHARRTQRRVGPKDRQFLILVKDLSDVLDAAEG